MQEEYKICPYTGLRPFTEDESIYFKGRDEHIDQATRQLEKNKFIMLTGASGDGKSSLVYAGIIPNAKAGFLKSTFSNWAIVDFRPERNPLDNLSKSLATQLGINLKTVNTELKHGFSSLVDMYKASRLYYNTKADVEGDEKLRSEKKRNAANLIILADQFEEFFTNPENFHKGVPSQEAMLVTNLLLETARISMEEKLPIYVIITMRSDFIGQCAAFRGLPEYIGFSQFFVPRLNRKQLQEVIEEPAILSGNKIARRLTERLIHDMVEGTDQLPILQHALNQIWKMADEGKAELDLIHYAMVGGMAGNDLPNDDINRFKEWFGKLPQKVQDCFDQPDLQNVLNTHANKLYSQVADYLKAEYNEEIEDEFGKLIVRTSFKCLTKIDNSRAVRNRMTLGEITAIINEPGLSYKKVGNVLNIFREPGNTLLRPFVDDEPELTENSVLDITHESLIRNWENLDEWANDEFKSYTVSLDFEQQLRRWVESGKSNDFLLYMGPLAYFENWFDTVKPNAAWMARYLSEDLERSQKLSKAEKTLNNAKDFLRRSARKHLVTRTVVRYGPSRIAAGLGLLALITLSSFMITNYVQQQNSYVLKELAKKSLTVVANSNVAMRPRAYLICEELRSDQTTLQKVIDAIPDPIEKINVMNGVAAALIYQGRTEPHEEILHSLTLADSLLKSYPMTEKNPELIDKVLREINDLGEALELGFYYNPSKEIDALRMKNAHLAADWSLSVLRNQSKGFSGISNLNRALEQGINHRIFSEKDIKELITILSPLGQTTRSGWVADNYNRENVSQKGFFSYGFNFNGLYQELAYLYGASGDALHALQCVDSLLKYNQNYFQNDYSSLADNASHIAACFYRYGNTNQLDEFVKGYCLAKKTTEQDFYARLLGRCKTYEFASIVLDVDPAYDLQLNLALEYSDDAQLNFFFGKYRDVISKLNDPDARNFYAALSYKDEGIIHLRKLEVEGRDSLQQSYLGLFDKAVTLYRSVSKRFLDEEIEVVELTNGDNIVQPRKFLFLYPDIRTPFHPNEPRLFHYFYTSACFLEYVMDHQLFDEFYPSGKELKFFEIFLRDYHTDGPEFNYTITKPIKYSVLANLEKNLVRLHASQFANLSYLYFFCGQAAAQNNESDRVAYYYGQITSEGVSALFINAFNPDLLFRIVGESVANETRFGHFAEGVKIVKFFSNSVNRSSLYAYAAEYLLNQEFDKPEVSQLIDSAKKEIKRTQNLATRQPNRVLLAYALVMEHDDDVAEAYKTIKNVEFKFIGIQRICRSLAFHGKLYEASINVPDNISDQDLCNFLWQLEYGYDEGAKIKNKKPQWNEFESNYTPDFTRFISFVK